MKYDRSQFTYTYVVVSTDLLSNTIIPSDGHREQKRNNGRKPEDFLFKPLLTNSSLRELVWSSLLLRCSRIKKKRVGILNIEEGKSVNGKWVPGRTMDGDQSHQGRHLRFEVDKFGIQKLKLHWYE